MNKTPEEFRKRIETKIHVEFGEKLNDVKNGQFWRYFEGINIGNEISKDKHFKRVCLVLNNNLGNGLILVAPITTKYHKWMEKYYVTIEDYEKYGLKEPRIILNQIKLIDRKRFAGKLSEAKISKGFTRLIMKKFSELLLR